MKCPKCGYISFDYNETCPKCQKGIVYEREKMHHLPFKPEPPFLLANLLAPAEDSQVGLDFSDSALFTDTQETELPFEEPSAVDIAFEQAYDNDEEKPDEAPVEIDLQEMKLEEDDLETYPPATDSEALPIEDLEFEDESSPEETVIEVSADEYDTALDEEALSLELEDLLEADKKTEAIEEKELDEDAMTIEMEAVEPSEIDSSPEMAPPVEGEETEEDLFDSFDIEEAETFEEIEHLDEEDVQPPPPIASEHLPGKPDELFSPDDLKGYRIGQFNILTQSTPPGSQGETPPSYESESNVPPSGKEGVWEEITKDLEDLEFDIEEP
jgi:hypothetical protein